MPVLTLIPLEVHLFPEPAEGKCISLIAHQQTAL